MDRCALILSVAVLFCQSAKADVVADFEDQGLPANSFVNNAGGGATGAFTSSGTVFHNSFSPSFGGIWSGWAISTRTDGTTAGFGNQYSAKPGEGADGSKTYGIGFTFGGITDPFHPTGSAVDLPVGFNPQSIDVTNTTYAYFSMKVGDSFSKPFGPGSFFKLDIQGYTGLNGTGTLVNSVDFYLADYRGGLTLVVGNWNTIDLTSLAGARSLMFGLQSSDNDPEFGMNSPAYFAADNLRLVGISAAVPEPSGLLLMAIGLGAGTGLMFRRRCACQRS